MPARERKTKAKPVAPAWAEAIKASAENERAGAAAEEDGSPYLIEAPPHPHTPARTRPMIGTGLPDWPRIRREAQALGGGPWGLFQWQEQRLVSEGFHPVGDWWAWNLENFFASMKRWFLCLGGRGMGKSTINTRMASICIDTDRRIPPGQTWIYPFVSARPADAKNRLFEISEIFERVYGLCALDGDGKPAVDKNGVAKPLKITSPEGTPTLPMLDSRGHSIAFVSFAATLGNVSGPNSIGATADEEEKIERSTAEIIGSLIATFRARPNIRGTRISSAMTARGSLYKDAKKGHTITNYVATIGQRWLDDARRGCLAVAQWEEEQRRDAPAAETMRRHAAGLTADSFMIPTWVGNKMHGPTPEARAVALRIEAEGVPEEEGALPPAAYFLREYCSRPDGLAFDDVEDDTPDEPMGDRSRYADETAEDRGYAERW